MRETRSVIQRQKIIPDEQLHRQNHVLIKMARSKGVREWKIVTKHTFRNALLTVITVVGQGFISALAGAAVVERLFNIPGMGSLMVDSIEKRDYQVIQAITLLIAMLNVFINLIIDLIYGLADPRIRLD